MRAFRALFGTIVAIGSGRCVAVGQSRKTSRPSPVDALLKRVRAWVSFNRKRSMASWDSSTRSSPQ